MNKYDSHYWSGWPGAYCLKCGAGDPNEQALAEGLWGFEEDPIDPNGMKEIWTGTPEQKSKLEEDCICKVKGELIWDNYKGAWDLKVDKQ
jgi:hypothetical protein